MKGILLYTTILVTLLFISVIDSVTNTLFIIGILVITLLITLCKLTISTEDIIKILERYE